MNIQGIKGVQNQLDNWTPVSQTPVGECGRLLFLKEVGRFPQSHGDPILSRSRGFWIKGLQQACAAPNSFVVPKVLAWGQHDEEALGSRWRP